MSDMIQRAAEVPFELGGQRLDQIAAQLFPEHSRSRLAGWIKDGRLTVDGAVLRPRDIVHSGAQLVLEAEQEAQGEWLAQDIELEIVYEDEHILVIDKPAGLVVHPAAGHQDGTLLNALLYHVPDIANVPRAGIVHRLDKDTTGLMVVAKTLEAHTKLVAQLQARSVSRIYEAIVIGVITSGGTIDAPIGRHGVQRQKMAVVDAGKVAVSHYRVLERFRAHTHTRVKLETGRTHQIRVHMSHIGYPLVGDPVYGGRFRIPRWPARPWSRLFANSPAGAARALPRTGSPGHRRAHEVGVAAAGRLPLAAQPVAPGSRGVRRMNAWLTPDWPAPARVRACVTTRSGGVSQAPFDSLNLGAHVDDDPRAVEENRRRLTERLECRPSWLDQVHGVTVVEADPSRVLRADASWSAMPGVACTIMTADCLPALFCDRSGTRVAAAHAGWRGLAAGVLEATVDSLGVPGDELLVWLGPAIGPQAFEVGGEVRDAFVAAHAEARSAFVPSANPGRFMADIYRLARIRLGAHGVTAVHGGGFCTFSDTARFYSYRRSSRTGRFASLVWLQD